MENDNLELKVQQIVSRIAFSQVTPEQPLISSQLLDSIGVVDLVVALEKEFGISLDLANVNEREFNSVKQIALKISDAVAT